MDYISHPSEISRTESRQALLSRSIARVVVQRSLGKAVSEGLRREGSALRITEILLCPSWERV